MDDYAESLKRDARAIRQWVERRPATTDWPEGGADVLLDAANLLDHEAEERDANMALVAEIERASGDVVEH